MQRAASVLVVVLVAAFAAACGSEAQGDTDALTDTSTNEDISTGSDVLPADIGDDSVLADTSDLAPADIGEDMGTPSDAETTDGPGDVAPDTGDDHLDDDDDGLTNGEERALGTDPNLADSDWDGIDDGEEVDDETDPTDPASARVWQPDLGPHPRLYFGPEDVPALRERVANALGPQALLYERIHATAEQTPPSNGEAPFDGAASQLRGTIAAAAAFVALMEEDADMAAKAAELLSAAFPSPLDLPPDSSYDIREAQGLLGYCTAYDLLIESDLWTGPTADAVRNRLAARIDAFRRTVYEGSYAFAMSFMLNNHQAKADTALGLCAIAFNERPGAAWEINQGLTGFMFVVADLQTVEEGGHAEGWNYLAYGSNNYLPFMAAYHRFAQGEARPYRNIATFTAGKDTTAGEVILVEDPAVDPRLRELYERALWATFPNGLTPNTDDANPSALHGGLLAALYDMPEFLWNWQKPAVNFAAAYAEIPTLALLDPEMTPQTPTWDIEQVFPTAGFALFRSDLSPTATWLMVQGEHGDVRRNGLGHEHPDATNVLFWYAGEYLLIDPGYGSWDQHGLVNQATDHNLVLVDGEGPLFDEMTARYGVDAFLEDWWEQGNLKAVTVRATYAGAEVTRRVLRIGESFFVIDDRAAPIDNLTHTYTFQMNGMAGEDVANSSFTLRANGATWERNGVHAPLYVVPTGSVGDEPAYETRAEEHATGYDQFESHTQLSVTSAMMAPGGFLSVLTPYEEGGFIPFVETGKPSARSVYAQIEATDAYHTLVLNLGTGSVTLAVGDHELTAPVGLSYVRTNLLGQPTEHAQLEGRILFWDGRVLD